MKKQNISNPFHASVKKFLFGFGLAGFLLIGSASGASAQDTAKPQPAAVSYIGSLDGQPVFKVDLDNKDGSVYNFKIKDDRGAVLYAEKITKQQFSKKFKFDRNNEEEVKLIFTLTSDKRTQSQEFRINTQTQVLNDIVVTKL